MTPNIHPARILLASLLAVGLALGGLAQDVAFAQGWSDNFHSYDTGATAASSLAAPLYQLPYTWWSPSWQYARVITVSTFANSPIDGYAGYTVRLVLNTTDGTRFLPSCDDLRIVYWNGATNIPLDRVVSNCGSSATEVWFRLQANIAPSSSDSSYVLYYGNPSAGGAPADPRQVYLWWDDFNRPDTVDITTELAYSKTGGGTWSIVSGQLRNVGAAGDPNKLLIDALGATVADVLMQTKISVTSWVGDSDLGRMGLSCCMISNGEGYAGLFHQDRVSLDLLNDLRTWGTYGTYGWSVGSWYNMAFRVIRPANRLGQIKVWPAGGPEPGSWTVDGDFGGGAARTNGYVGLGGSRQADITLFDDLFIRKIVDPEPALGLSIEHSLAEQNPELTLTKTIVSGDPYSTVGGTVNYSYAVLNSGDVSLPGPVTVTDDKATATCPAVTTVGNLDAFLDPGESLTCTASHTVIQADLNAGSVTNLASAFAAGTTSNTDSKTAVAISDPAVTKSANPATVQIGDTVTFTLAVTNTGPGNADNVILTDPIPAFLDIVLPVTVVPVGPTPTVVGNNVTVAFGTLAPAATYTVTITTVVNSLGAPPGGTNSATVTTTSPDSDPANNASSALVTIVTAAGAAPGTGFSPGRTTIVPAQPEALRYSSYGDLWIEIPELGVKLPIVGVQLTQDGWDVTWLGSQAGYLNGTAFPTWKGNSVLTSHVTLPSGRAGPFRNLKNLRWDDTVIVHYAGQRYAYSVRSTSAETADNPSIFRHEERSWLTLVTCGGYDAKLGEYRYRIVVKAVLTSIELEL